MVALDYVGFEAIASVNVSSKPWFESFINMLSWAQVDYIFDFLTTTNWTAAQITRKMLQKFLAICRINKTFSVNANTNLVWNDFSRHTNIDQMKPDSMRC